MKIVFMHDNAPARGFAGATISTYDLAVGVKDAGHEVSIITTCRDESEAGESDYLGMKVFKIATNYGSFLRAYLSLYNPRAVSEVSKILKELKPDVVHIQNVHFYLSYHSIKVAKRFSKVVVVTLRDAMSFSFGKLQTKHYLETQDAHLTWLDNFRQTGKKWNPFRNMLIKYYLGLADKLFAVSKSLKLALEQNGINNVEVMHTGVDLKDWEIGSESNQDKPVVFFSGVFGRSKGGDVVDKVMTRVKSAIPNAELFGIGEDKQWLNRDEMKRAYASSRVVLVPSVCFDAFPRVVIESMAMGRPVISTPYGGAKEAIVDGKTGYIVSPFKIDEMADKIIDLLKNSDKARQFGEAGRERIEKNFNLDDKVNAHIACYSKLLSTK